MSFSYNILTTNNTITTTGAGYFVQPAVANPVKETPEAWLRRRVAEMTELAVA